MKAVIGQSRLTEAQAKESLLECLRAIPFAQVEPAEGALSGDAEPDGVFRISLPGREIILVLEVKTNSQPRYARAAANQLFRYLGGREDAYGVFAAPYISERSTAILRAEGLGYIDLAGNCRLVLPGVYIERSGRPNSYSEKRELRSLYSPKAERVLRVLLADPHKRWKLQTLAAEARVSLGQAYNVKELLANQEWIRQSKDGLTLSEPEQLLLEWARSYDFRRNRVKEFYSLRSLSEAEAAIADLCNSRGIRYALAGFSAAVRLAPFVRYQKASAYVWGDIQKLAAELELREVGSGANLSLIEPYDEGVLYGLREVDGQCIVASVQAYLDLKGRGGRGEEAADFILAQVLRPSW